MRNNTNPFILDRINQELFFSLQSVIVKENLDGFIGAILMEPNNCIKRRAALKFKKPNNLFFHVSNPINRNSILKKRFTPIIRRKSISST